MFAALRYLSLGAGQEQAGAAHKEEAAARKTSATAVYEVARPILQSSHAIPTKLKILLDRALSALSQEEVLMIVSGCGWQLDDYQRGYKLKVCSHFVLIFGFSEYFVFSVCLRDKNFSHLPVKPPSLLQSLDMYEGRGRVGSVYGQNNIYKWSRKVILIFLLETSSLHYGSRANFMYSNFRLFALIRARLSHMARVVTYRNLSRPGSARARAWRHQQRRQSPLLTYNRN